MNMKIYLSPSNQPKNLYAGNGTNEKVQMENVARHIKSILDSEYNCETVMATLSLDIGMDGRPKEAKDKGCNVYLALHSNAGGGKASGAVAFYHPSSLIGKTLAANIVRELDAICPTESNRSKSIASGMTQFNGQGYGEIRNPSKLGSIAVLAETDFHDNPTTAHWITANNEAIARAYVAALVKTFDISKKERSSVQDQIISPRYYRVQVGVYLQKSGAEEMLKKLETAGFEGYIKCE